MLIMVMMTHVGRAMALPVSRQVARGTVSPAAFNTRIQCGRRGRVHGRSDRTCRGRLRRAGYHSVQRVQLQRALSVRR